MGKTKSVGIFLPGLFDGGAERVALVLADQFIQLGIRVDLVLAHYQGGYLKQIPPGVRVVDLKANRMILAVPKLIKYFQTNRPDVILSQIDLANVIVFIAKLLSRRRVPWVICQVSYPQPFRTGKLIKDRLIDYFLIWAFRSADRIIAVSKGVKSQIISLSNVPDEKVIPIYNATDYSQIEENSRQPIQDNCFSEANQVVISAGRLSVVKDFPTLIKAFEIVHQEKPNVRLVILGEGQERPRLEELIRQLKLEGCVSLPGFIENPFSYLSKASVFVLSSLSEGFGNVLVEAMACGCPVISTDCPTGPSEILHRGEFGHLIPIGDSVAMSNAILAVLNGDRKTVPPEWLNQFRPDVIARQYLDVFDNLPER